jgi:acyl-homoserine-lactone acylase
MRDGNIVVTRALQQFLAMDRSLNMTEFQAAHENYTGIPWVNTIAASVKGRAWYADTATTPYLSDETNAAWRAAVAAGGTVKLVDDNGATLLDGSDPANEWVVDPEAPAPGLLPYRLMPKLERTDYVFNANDSHWLANPAELLTGFPPMTGIEGTVQSARTRMNAAMLGEDGAGGSDGKFSLAEAQESILSNRALTAEVLRAAVVTECTGAGPIDVDGTSVDIAVACATLSQWDGRFNTDSVGAIVWREFLNRFDGDAQSGVSRALYEVPFDPTRPATTPNTPTTDRSSWLPNLAKAVQLLDAAGIPVDAPLGDFQFDGRAGRGPALGGGWGGEGLANVIDCCARGGASTAPDALNPTFSDDGAFATTPLGYPVTEGTSFLMAVQFTDGGPQARAFLTYGQPDDPNDPRFRSQTELFGDKAWRTVAFEEADIKGDPEFTSTIVTGAR